ncbi:lymphocyte antigen 6H-like isoform X2 [Equus asinus]|uniref:lymphocyte antigen 6H-like isoform X2 n=1 Tax=Equus asinus TaxID=9793 RepID=UPI001D05410B|nr:lymphocyte antigen 6H-like isoform X2 [Equus asinus]
MKGIYLVLLAVLLCSQQALSLQCYNCTEEEDVSKCQTTISCDSTPSICYKGGRTLTKTSGQVVKLHSKGCASSCDDVYDMMEQLVEKMISEDRSKLELWAPDCCGKDLCNRVAQACHTLRTPSINHRLKMQRLPSPGWTGAARRAEPIAPQRVLCRAPTAVSRQ